MGLDLVELVMEVEDAFGISIPDEEAGSLTTVGALIGYVHKRLQSYKSDTCATAAAFYRIRRLFMQKLPLNRADIKPDSSLAELIPAERRREIWSELAVTESQRLPRLQRPAWLSCMGLALGVLVPVFYLASAVLSLTVLLFLLIGIFVTRRWATRFPATCQTIRELALRLARPAESASLSEAEIAHRVRLIVCDQLGWELAEIHDNRRFPD